MSRSDYLDPWGGRRGRRGRAPDRFLLAELEAIDATLAGEPVDPDHAELAELALLLADTAPRPAAEFTRALDRRVAGRFAAAGPDPAVSPASAGTSRGARAGRWSPRRLSRGTRFAGFGGALAVVAAAAVAVVIVTSQPRKVIDHFNQSAPLGVVHSTAGGGATSRSTAGGIGTVSGGGIGATNSPDTFAAVPTPSGTGGHRIQSAQITLTAPNARINQVAQEVFDVVGQERGSVKSSQITTATSGNGGSYASFTLSVPVGNLQAAMTRLSQLAHTAVTSRTDSIQNVSDQYATDQRKLADAQALRTSLLKQLQAATTQNATSSLEKQIRDAEAAVTRAQTALESLQHRISNSSVSVTINAGRLPGPQPLQGHRHSYLHRALHDAVHVLVVAAGVALIAVAVAIPVAALLLLLGWIGLRLRRRGRERALDQA